MSHPAGILISLAIGTAQSDQQLSFLQRSLQKQRLQMQKLHLVCHKPTVLAKYDLFTRCVNHVQRVQAVA